MNHGTHKKHENKKSSISELAQKIKPLVEDIIRIQKQAKSLGIFVNDRELLECTGCVSGIRLTQIPAARGKRRIVLERLAMEFEPGLRYQEREVNLILEAFHADYTSLRRYLIDEGFLSREDGIYWRSGGRM